MKTYAFIYPLNDPIRHPLIKKGIMLVSAESLQDARLFVEHHNNDFSLGYEGIGVILSTQSVPYPSKVSKIKDFLKKPWNKLFARKGREQ